MKERHGDQRQPGEARRADRNDGERPGADSLREPGGGHLDHLRGERKSAEKSDDDRARSEKERPTGEDRAAGAGTEHLCGGALSDGGVE